MLVPYFQGGLGNMMFQYGATYSVAKQTGHDFGVFDIPRPPLKHSCANYKESIFLGWEKYKTSQRTSIPIQEKDFNLERVKSTSNSTLFTLKGYFQHEKYLRPCKDEVVRLFDLSLDRATEKKYHDLQESCFLQVRRGDYVGNTYHELNLENFYKRATERVPGAVFYVVSNDLPWCEDWSFLKDLRCRFVKEDEVTCLRLMSRCGLGGISANSSFGWWGLYLNTARKHLYLPEKWYPHNFEDESGYRFREGTQLSL